MRLSRFIRAVVAFAAGAVGVAGGTGGVSSTFAQDGAVAAAGAAGDAPATASHITSAEPQDVFVEAESFAVTGSAGGWVIDQQFAEQMGSPYLLAHGLGRPVADAKATVRFPAAGSYRLFVRTFNWTAPWSKKPGPGKFQVLVDGAPAAVEFGTAGDRWQWQSGGTVKVAKPEAVEITLRDLTGFDGRCDALFFTRAPEHVPPDDAAELAAFRRRHSPERRPQRREFDLVVAGGGVAGICAAVTAARLGLKVALVQDRPVYGGNNSSEVRVHIEGRTNHGKFPRLGDVVREVQPPKHARNASPAGGDYADERKAAVVSAEPNITQFLNCRASGVRARDGKITSVLARHNATGETIALVAPLFADCTGDGSVGAAAGADFLMGREGRYAFGESLAPAERDKKVMGASVLWATRETAEPSPFPVFKHGLVFNEKNARKVTYGEWFWEAGTDRDQIRDAERIRDLGLLAAFSNWSFLKNEHRQKEKYARRELQWVAHIAGKRESRRLLGDIVLREQDVRAGVEYPDGCVPTAWPIDLHYPEPKNSRDFPGNEFITINKNTHIKTYHIPYRCLYSRNIANLFMAGRDISVTHVALGTVRVMRTTGMMGEVVGMAAAIARRHNCSPRTVYAEHLAELQELLKRGAGKATGKGAGKPPPAAKTK